MMKTIQRFYTSALLKKEIKQTQFSLDNFWIIISGSVCLWETRNLLFPKVAFFKFCTLVSSKSTESYTLLNFVVECCLPIEEYNQIGWVFTNKKIPRKSSPADPDCGKVVVQYQFR